MAASDTLKVTLSAPEGGTVAEGETGHFEVSVKGSTAGGAVTVRYSVSGTATAGVDYTALRGEVSVAQGDSVARIALSALEDGVLDRGEAVVLALTGATGPGTVVVDQTAATATIADDGTVAVALTPVADTIAEGGTWSSTVTMSTPVADRVSVRWWTRDGTARAGEDYKAANAVVSFEPGETSKPIEVTTLEDDDAEPVEIFYVSLDPPSVSARAATARAVRVDAEAHAAFIECSVAFPPTVTTLFTLLDSVPANTVIGTVAAETTDGIPYYSLTGGQNKFTIDALTAEISTTSTLGLGTYYLTVTVDDECGAQASIDVTVTVESSNAAPNTDGTIPDDSVEVDRSDEVDVSGYFSDPNGDDLTYTAGSSNTGVLGVSVTGSTVTYTGKTAGTATVTVTARDPGGLSADQEFTVTVVPGNGPPVRAGTIPPAALDVGQRGSVDVFGYFSDPDDDELTFSASSSNSDVLGTSTSGVRGRLVGFSGDSVGTATVTVTATDPGGLSATQEFDVRVTQPNRPPTVTDTIANREVHVGRTGSVAVRQKFDDPDGDRLTYSASSDDMDVVSVSVNGSNVRYTGVSVGSTTVTVTAKDQGGLYAKQEFTVTVPNRAPIGVALIPNGTVHVGESGSVDVSSNFDDPDDDQLTYSADPQTAGVVSVTVSGSTVNYRGEGVGSTSVGVTATDPGGLWARLSFVATVPNRASTTVGTIGAVTVHKGDTETVEVAGAFSEPDKQTLTYSASSSNEAVARVSGSGSEVTVTGVSQGKSNVTVTATDPGGLFARQVFAVTVPNRRPTAEGTIADQTIDLGDRESVDVSSKFDDPDGDALTYTASSSDSDVGVSVSGSTVTYTGDAAGSATVTVTATDPGGLSADQSFEVTVLEPCYAPGANAGTDQTVRELQRVTLTGSGTNAVRYSWRRVSGPSVTLTGANTATPWFDAPSVAADAVLRFRLTTTSDCGATATDDVSVTVRNNRGPGPVGTIQARTVSLGATDSVAVSGYFQDPDNDVLTYGATSSDGGKVSVSVSRDRVRYEGEAVGSATVTVTARDRYGATARQAFRVTVTDPNHAPEVVSAIPAMTVAAETSEEVDVSGHFRDPNGDDLTYGATSSDTTVATVSVEGSEVTVTGVSRGTSDVTVQATDEHGASVSQAFTVTVPNRTPEAVGEIGARSVEAGASGSVDVSGHFSDPDGDDLGYAVSSSDTAVATVAVTEGQVMYAGVAAGESEVTVTATDGHGGSAQQRFTVTVTDPNDAPEVVSAIPAMTVPAETSEEVDVSGHFRDPNGDDLTYGATSSHTAVATVSVEGSEVTVTGVSRGTSDVTVQATDEHGASVSQAFTVTVPNRAPGPVGTLGAVTVHKGGADTVEVAGAFSDPDGDALTYAASSSAEAVARVSVDGSEVTVTGVSRGEAHVTVQATDGHGGSAEQEFTVTVANRAPEAVGEIGARSVEAGASGSVDVSGHFSDPDGDALGYAASSSDTAVATVSVTAGEVRYAGVARGESEVTVTASDGRGGEATQRFTVRVTGPNRAPEPVGTLGAVTVHKGAADRVEVARAFSDPDGDSLTYTASSSAEGVATARVSGSAVTVAGISQGEARVTVTASDGRGGTAEQAFDVTVPNRAPEPVGEIGARSVDAGAGGSVEVSGHFSDPDGDELGYAVSSSDTAVATVSVTGGEVTYAGISVGESEVTVTASDGHGGSAEQRFTLTVRQPNRAPKPAGSIPVQSVAVSGSGTVDVSPYFTDADGDHLSYAVSSSDTAVVTLSVADSLVTYAGVSRGEAEVTVTASDGRGGSAEQRFRVSVGNTAPVAVGRMRELTLPPGGGAARDVTNYFRDDDGDTLTYTASSSDTTVVRVRMDGKSLNADALRRGEVEVTVTASDGRGGSAVQRFTVTVLNRAPEAEGKIAAVSVAEGASGSLDMSEHFSDPDGDTLTYTASSSDTAVATVSVTDGEVTYAGISVGESEVTVTASDSHGGSAEQRFTVTVTAANQAPEPVGTLGTVTVHKGGADTVEVAGAFSDPDGDTLTYTASSSNDSVATASVSGSEVTVAGISQGEARVTVTASDGRGGTAEQAFDVTVPNRTPVAVGRMRDWTLPPGGAGARDVTNYFRDDDGDTLTYTASSSDTTVVRVRMNGTSLKADGLRRGEVEVTVTASDGRGGTAEQRFTATVESANRAPSFDAASYEREVPENSVAATEVGEPVTATDPDGASLSYGLVGDGSPFAIDEETGQLTVVEGAVLNYESGDTLYALRVEASDGELADTAAVTVRVTDADDPGTITLSAQVARVGVELTATLMDEDGSRRPSVRRRWQRSDDGTSWTDIANATGRAYTPVAADAGKELRAVFTYTDGHGPGKRAESPAVPVEVPNRAPTFGADAYEREVAENSAAGTEAGAPVTATDEDLDTLAYRLVAGGPEFAVDEETGQITVAEGAVLDYESGDTLYALSVEASDGTLADTAAVTIRVTDVSAPGRPAAPAVTGGTGEVTATWAAPANEGPEIADYDRRHRARGDSAWTEVPGLGAVLTHTVAGLEASTTYQVQVRAESSEGSGEWSDSGEGTTAPPANRAPAFDSAVFEREVAENSAAGTEVGAAVTATDPDSTALSYGFVGDGAPFAIDEETGQITVAAGAALNYESGDTLYALSVEARDGELADTAAVTVRVTDADDPGTVTLSAGVARVGVEITATLMDEDMSREADKTRRWQRSDDGTSWTNIAGATGRTYTPVAADQGKRLRAVFTYTDGHGPGKRAESAAVRVTGTNVAPSFGADAYEREVAENSDGGTAVGEPVTATDANADELSYRLVNGGSAFAVDAATGQVTVAEDAALNYESGDTLHALSVEASDGELADTAAVTVRVTNADDPGKLTLSAEVARVGERITATLMDEDGSRDQGKRRRWQRSDDGTSWTNIPGATGRAYTPVAADRDKYLRAVFTYADGHGPGKRAESAALRVTGPNQAPGFGAASYEREVAENSGGGTAVGEPVTATDANADELAYRLVAGGPAFAVDAATGQIRVAEGAALNYESGDTLHALSLEASDGELADTAALTVRVTNADDPGKITLSVDVARVGERITATLMDEDGSKEPTKVRWWERSDGDAAWTDITGARTRFYTPVTADVDKYLRAVFTYEDGHAPGKRAESAAVLVVAESTLVVSFGAESYTAAAGGSADVEVLLSPAATAALAVPVVAGDSTHTVTFQTGESTRTLAVGTVGLSAPDTVEVRFGTLPEDVVAGVPDETRVVVTAAPGDTGGDGELSELEVEYAATAYRAVAGGPAPGITLRMTPAADRRVAVTLTAVRTDDVSHGEPYAFVPDPVVFAPGDSLRTFALAIPAGTEPVSLTLGFGELPEAVVVGPDASATLDIAAADDAGALLDEAFDVGLAVFGRAVAEGARQAVGARIDAIMRPDAGSSSTAAPSSAAEWAGRAAGTFASLTGLPLGGSSLAGTAARRAGSLELPTGRKAAERLLPRISFSTALGPQARDARPRFGLWAEGSAQGFRGEPGGVDYDGGLRALAVGADARIGSSGLAGISVMRSDGDLDFTNRSADGTLGHAMNSVHPYLFLQPSPKIGLWAMAGYGSGAVEDDARPGASGATLHMLSGGVKVPLARRGAFGLALSGDAFTVGMRADEHGREGSATRARALLEASWTAHGLRLATQAGARYEGGDADTGAGAETGGSLGYAGHGLDLALNGRLALGAGSHREWGAALRFAFDPGTRGEGFRFALSPARGHDRSGIHGLLEGGHLNTMYPAARSARDWRLDGEAGYAVKSPGNGGGLDSYTRFSAGARGRSWSLGTRYHLNQTLRLGVEGARSQRPGQNPGLGLRLGVDFNF